MTDSVPYARSTGASFAKPQSSHRPPDDQTGTRRRLEHPGERLIFRPGFCF